MALDFSSYLNVAVESIEQPKAPPIGHYFATIKDWKAAERNYNKASGGAPVPVVQIDFLLTSPDDDVDPSELPKGGIKGRVVNKDYTLNDEFGPAALRALAEKTCALDVKGLNLSDLLPQLKGQEVKVYLEQRAGQEEGQFFSVVKKVLSANG